MECNNNAEKGWIPVFSKIEMGDKKEFIIVPPTGWEYVGYRKGTKEVLRVNSVKIMKSRLLIVSIGIILLSLYACKNPSSFIVGEWEIEGVGNMDTAYSKESVLTYALFTMQSKGTRWEFSKDSIFRISYNNQPSVRGTYWIENNKLFLKSSDGKETGEYEIIKKSDTKIQLKLKSSFSFIELTKVH